MKQEYKTILESASKNKHQLHKVFRWLKKNKPSDLDYVTNHFHEMAFEKITCLECANCCKSTGPLLLNKDIERLAKHFRIKPSEFTERYLTIDTDGDYVFKTLPCPFLNHHYCSVYESRPNACREYPHTQQRQIIRKLAITEKNATICPAVSLVADNLKRHYRVQ